MISRFLNLSKDFLLVAGELGMETILFNRDGVEFEGNVVDDFGALGEMLEDI